MKISGEGIKTEGKIKKGGRGNEVRADGREEWNWPVVAYTETHNI